MRVPIVDFEKKSYNNGYVHYAIIIVVCFFAFFINNHITPVDIMESRNLATAQEIIKNGNYLTPTMNGELRLEKPPLPTWIAAIIDIVTPNNILAQRCAAGVMASLMVLFLYFIVSKLTNRRSIALMSSLVLATSFNVILIGRMATWDIYCHSFMLGAIYFFILAFDGEGKQWRNFILTGIFLGLSFLSKGPVSFYALFLPFLISYIAIYRPSVKGKVLPLITMIVICLVLSFWWIAYVYIFHKEMLLNIAHKESSSWVNRNVRPWYYYWQFPGEAGIWALLFVSSVVAFFAYKKEEFRNEYKFGLLWTLVSLILLSLIPEKKTRYLLPVLIPIAIPVAFYFYHGIKGLTSKSEKVIFRVNATLLGIILLAIPFVLYFMFFTTDEISLFVLSLATIISWFLAFYIYASVYCYESIAVSNVFCAIIVCMMMVMSVCMIPIGNTFINKEAINISELRKVDKVQKLPFFYTSTEPLRIELVYGANQIIREMDVANDSTVYNNTPFVLLSGYSIDSLFRNRNVEVEFIGRFDNNWRKIDHKRYNPDLVRNVAIIRKKNTTTHE